MISSRTRLGLGGGRVRGSTWPMRECLISDLVRIRFARPPGAVLLSYPRRPRVVASCDVLLSISAVLFRVSSPFYGRRSVLSPTSSFAELSFSHPFPDHDQFLSLPNVPPLFINPPFSPCSSVLLNTALLQWAFTIRADPKHPIDDLAFTESANAHPKPFKVVFEPRVGGGSVEGIRELMEEHGVYVVRSRGIGGIALHVNLFLAYRTCWIAGEDVLF